MRRKILVFLMTTLMIVVFIPTISFAVETDESAGGAPDVQIQEDLELLFCEGDIDPDARQIIEKRDTKGLTEERRAAHTRLRELMNSYADTEYYRNSVYYIQVPARPSEDEYNILAAVAEEATAECTSDYEIIKAIYELVAENIYYDYDVINGVRQYTDYGYDAWVNQTTICGGYSQLCTIFLNAVGIPCMYARGDRHAYNVAYDSQEQRWIFFDTTWGSKNKYQNGEKQYGGHTMNYFDLTVNAIASLRNHEYYERLHIVTGEDVNLKCSMQAPEDASKWMDTSLWEMYVDNPIDKNTEEINIAPSLFGLPVVAISKNAFKECSNLTSIAIPDSVMSIGSSAFEGCSNLTAVAIPAEVTSIGSDAFEGCSSLTSVNIPAGVTKINDDTFFNCESLTGITIPNGVTSIGFRAFDKCKSLTDITIPGSVETIYNSAFCGDDNLESVTVMEGATSIGNSMFSGCSALTSVTLPDSLMSIGNSAFIECKSLTNITIPAGVTSMGDRIFTNCFNLESITLPSCITSIPEGTFFSCHSLKNVIIPDSVTSIEETAFLNCYALDHVTIPDGVTSIGDRAFSFCSNLSQIKVPESVTSIGNDVFKNSNSVSIFCKKYSYAHSYAVDNNISYSLWTSLKDCDIAIEQKEYHTTGEPIKPAIKVSDEDTILTEGVHYSVLTSNVTVGESTVTIKGLGDYTDEVTLPFIINDHTWNEEYTVDKAATCTESGTESMHCSICGATKDKKAIPAAGHKFGKWILVTPNTCDGEGLRQHVCETCGFTEDEKLAALGHDWETVKVEAALLQNAYTYDKCTKCGATQNKVVSPNTGWANSYVKSFKVTGGKKSFTAKWKKQSAANQKKFNGYQIRYSLKSSMKGAKTATAKKSSASKTIKKLKKGKKYYVQVRTYTKKDGTTFYSKWSAKKTVKVK
ncbi:MAG: leucine-rich repeat protein [Firmicutes bacterium]|nr:leucine-rich repeat protein [Bacillota bacterium]